MMMDPVWDALFAATYQLSDETDAGEGINPETDSKEVAISVPSQPWVTRPPNYQAAIVSLQSQSSITRLHLPPTAGYRGHHSARPFGEDMSEGNKPI
jgi:hypothetical protein